MATLLLFDIDGTLISARGIPKKIFLRTMRKLYPAFTNGQTLNFSGLTDPLIARKILAMNGFEQGAERERAVAQLLTLFLQELEQELTEYNPPIILPGVWQLLSYCHKRADCYLALVTGNMQRGAEIKLRAAGLYHYFPVGAYGSDHESRDRLPPLAIKRAQAYYGRRFQNHKIWVIGDSVHDVRCAAANGLKSLAVATGVTPREILLAEKPTELVEDLHHTQQVLSLLLT